MTEQELLDMPLHQSKVINKFMVTRVVGGWIYFNEKKDRYSSSIALSESSTFVPEPVNPRERHAGPKPE